MENEDSLRGVIANVIGGISLGISSIMIVLILNWFFTITPYQKLEGMPLLITPFITPIGFIMGVISFKISRNTFGKWGVISNVILFILPFLYWYLGTLIFGP